MPRWSKSKEQYEPVDGDRVKIMGVVGAVETVFISRMKGIPTHRMVFVRFPRQEVCNVYNLSEIEAVKIGTTDWVTLKGEPVTC